MRKLRESRDPGATRIYVPGLLSFSFALFLIVQALLRGNDAGWSSAQIVGSLVFGVLLLAAFVVIEVRQERPMLDVSLFKRPAFLGVQAGTFAIGAGMFALFPFLSIYLQDILGYSPLGAGLRFLPITVFVFFVPIATRKLSARVPMWALLSVSLAIVALGAILMADISADSSWLALLPGFVVAGLGIGLANPTIAAAALRVVDPARTGMASGISNTCRLGGLAMGVAVLARCCRYASSITSPRRAIRQAARLGGQLVGPARRRLERRTRERQHRCVRQRTASRLPDRLRGRAPGLDRRGRARAPQIRGAPGCSRAGAPVGGPGAAR